MNLATPESGRSNAPEMKITLAGASKDTLGYTRYVRADWEPRKRVVLLHGFTQNSSSFTNIAEQLAANNEVDVICADLPGHGSSSQVEATLTESMDLLRTFGTRSIWVGYSLGARHLLSMCVSDPATRWNVILSGVNPGIEDPGAREKRYLADLALAQRLKQLDGDERKFETFLRDWMSQPIFQPRNIESADLEIRLANVPRYLARSLELSSVGVQKNYWPSLNALSGNFTFINGGADAKYLAITRRIVAGLANTTRRRRIVLEDLGHSALFDRTEFLIHEITDSINQH